MKSKMRKIQGNHSIKTCLKCSLLSHKMIVFVFSIFSILVLLTEVVVGHEVQLIYSVSPLHPLIGTKEKLKLKIITYGSLICDIIYFTRKKIHKKENCTRRMLEEKYSSTWFQMISSHWAASSGFDSLNLFQISMKSLLRALSSESISFITWYQWLLFLDFGS